MVLFNAWTKVWLDGSQQAIEASNRFVDAAIPATEAASAPEQQTEYAEALKALGRLRIDFAK